METGNSLKCQTCFRPRPESGMQTQAQTPAQAQLPAQSHSQWISVCRCDRPYLPSTRFSIDVCANCKRPVAPKLLNSTQECPGICSCASSDPKKVPGQIRQGESDAVSLDLGLLKMTPGNFPHERYSAIGILGDGPRATVILARDKIRGTKVAVKCFKRLHPSLQGSFQNEVKKNQQLSHANIIRIVDSGFTSGNTPYLVTEYKDGLNLEQCLCLYGTPSYDVAVKILIDVCDAVLYAQKQKLLHRNIKPTNIIFYDDMNAEPSVYLTDFALSEASAAELPTDPRDARFMTADDARNLDYSEKSEIYAIGCIGYMLLTGQAPFSNSKTVHEIKNLHALTLPPRISDLRFDNTRARDLDELIERCLEKDPDYRFDSVAQLAERLQVFPRRELAQFASALAAGKNRGIIHIASVILVTLSLCVLLYFILCRH